MEDVTIKVATEDDVDMVASILQEAAQWLHSHGIAMWKGDQLLPEKIRGDVAAGLYWIAFVGGESAGCVRFQTQDVLFWPDVPPEESAFIHRLAVRRQFSGGRVSSAIIAWAKNRAVSLGKRFLRLDCDTKLQKLRHIYETSGFRVHSERQVGPYLVARYEADLVERCVRQ